MTYGGNLSAQLIDGDLELLNNGDKLSIKSSRSLKLLGDEVEISSEFGDVSIDPSELLLDVVDLIIEGSVLGQLLIVEVLMHLEIGNKGLVLGLGAGELGLELSQILGELSNSGLLGATGVSELSNGVSQIGEIGHSLVELEPEGLLDLV